MSWQHHPINQYLLTPGAKVHRNFQSSDCERVPIEALVVSTLDVSFVIASVEFFYSFWCFPLDCQCVVPDGGDPLTFTSCVLALRSFHYIAWFI